MTTLTPVGLAVLLNMVQRPCSSPVGECLGARDRVLLTRVSALGCEVLLSCLQEGLGAEPGLSDIIIIIMLWIDAWASTGTGCFGVAVGALLWG